MEATAILPTYMSELKAQDNIRVLIHDSQRIVYQVDCVDGTGTVEVLTLFPGVVLQFHSFHCKSFHLAESKEVGNSLKSTIVWKAVWKCGCRTICCCLWSQVI